MAEIEDPGEKKLMKDDFEPFLAEYSEAYRGDTQLVDAARKLLEENPEGTYSANEVMLLVSEEVRKRETKRQGEILQQHCWR